MLPQRRWAAEHGGGIVRLATPARPPLPAARAYGCARAVTSAAAYANAWVCAGADADAGAVRLPVL